jgi:hypothetical protein
MLAPDDVMRLVSPKTYSEVVAELFKTAPEDAELVVV